MSQQNHPGNLTSRVVCQMAASAADRARGEQTIKAAKLEPEAFRAAKARIAAAYDAAIEAAYASSLY